MTRRIFLNWFAIGLAAVGTSAISAADGDVRIRLSGAGGIGSAKYRDRRGVREFEVEAENLRLPAGSALLVTVNGVPVGTMAVTARRSARLNLNTQLGQATPVIVAGAVVTVFAPNGLIVMGGQF